MPQDAWDEFNEITTRLEALEQELAMGGAADADNTRLLDEIRRVSARRETLLAGLWDATDSVAPKASTGMDRPVETAPTRRYSRGAGGHTQRQGAGDSAARRRRLGASY